MNQRDLYLEVLGLCRTDGTHLYWRSKAKTITKERRNYNVRHVLMRGNLDEPSPGYFTTCGENNCILPEHLRVYKKREPRIYTHCRLCDRAVRPWGCPKEEAPHTVAKGSNGLCSSCYRVDLYGKGVTVEGLDDIQVALVKRKVPEDLWSYFGV